MFAYMFVSTENRNKHVHRARSLQKSFLITIMFAKIVTNVCPSGKISKVEKYLDAKLRERTSKK